MHDGSGAIMGQPSRFGAQRLYRDAVSLATSSVVNAVLGIAFWALAAKLFPPEKLGVMTAVLAVIVSVGVVVSAGVGDAYTALLPAVGTDRPHFYKRGQRVFFGLAFAGGIAAAMCTTSWLTEVHRSASVAALVAIGTVVWATASLQNATLAALGRAQWLPAVNVALSVGKMALLPLLAVTLDWHPVELSAVLSATAVMLVVRRVIVRTINSSDDLPASTGPDSLSASKFNTFVAQTFLSSGVSMGAFLVTPFLVSVFADTKQGALFALSLSIVQALDLLGAALSMSLAVHASSSPQEASAMARAIMVRIVFLAGIGSAVIIAVAPIGLRLLNPQYGAMGATHVIAVLAVGAVLRCTYQVWSGLQRARRRMAAPLVVNVIAATTLLATMPGLCASYGALGGAVALMLASLAMTLGIVVHFEVSRQRRRHMVRHGSAKDF
jgi:O-antigen/teichoic acid export membrane protein